ncbi:MAG: phosphate acyltransferase PlsX [Chloroflexota bacterium]
MDVATVRGIEHGRRVRLAIDAMGGDYAPDEVVAGSLLYAAENPDDEVILVGAPERIAALAGTGFPSNVTVEAAAQVIEMHEHPALALREKKNASILVACDLVKRGRADAVITAGHTGAGMAAAVLRLGRARGVDRPALAIQMVTDTGPLVLLDIGANPDSTPENLAQYARMGSLFAERALGIDRPRVALLSIGEEKGKGDARIQRASELLEASDLNFTGNVEGKDLVHHPADVVVCDAILGNVIIKFFEGLAGYIFDLWAKEFQGSLRGKIAYLLMRPGVGRIRRTFDYEALGGSPLLGVRGTVVITHGRAKRRMVKHAIRVGAASARARLPELIGDAFGTRTAEPGDGTASTAEADG